MKRCVKPNSNMTMLFTTLFLFLAMVKWLKGIELNNSTFGQVTVDSHRIYGRISGEFMVAALFPVHETPMLEGDGDPLTCGVIREYYGIQRIEAAFFAIDQINKDTKLLPNITLGIEIRDSCLNVALALQQTIKLIRKSVPADEGSSGEHCIINPEEDNYPLIGLLGPGSSDETIQVHNLLQMFHIPQVGYSATSDDLSDKRRFSHFLRVVPPDIYQILIILNILHKYDWTYISIVSTVGNYGESLQREFKYWSDTQVNHTICIALSLEIDSNSADEDDYDQLIDQLSIEENAQVVILFCEGIAVKRMFDAFKRRQNVPKFTFIGTDGWAGRISILGNITEEAEGSIVLAIDSPSVNKFDEYYLSLNVNNNSRNPWFKEFWQFKLNCTFNSNSTQFSIPLCTGKEDLQIDYKQDSKVPFVIKSVYTLAHGLHNMILDVCKGLSPCDKLYPFNGTLLMDYLFNVSFLYQGEEVKFDSEGDPISEYKILNYQQFNDATYKYVHIGSWNKSLNIWKKPKFRNNEMVTSVCSLPCAPGYFKNIKSQGQREDCCWVCQACKQNAILVDDYNCEDCKLGFWPDSNKTTCEKIIPSFIHWSDIQALVSVAVSCIGIGLTLATAIIFIKFNDTPVVKSSTRELSYMMMFGMCLAHCFTFAKIYKPTYISCIFVRILPGLSFTIIYAALIVKTNRIARILAISKKKFPNMSPRFMSTTAQICISCLLISVELAICTYLLYLEPPDPVLGYPEESLVIFQCNMSDRALVLPLLFNSLLVLLCTLYAIKTRNLPQNFNEAKFIGFSMYTTCITWVAFVLIYFGSKLKVVTMCVSISTNSMVILLFLFFPKLYIILFRPKRNTRANFTTSKGIRCYIGNSSSKLCSCTSQATRMPKAENTESSLKKNLQKSQCEIAQGEPKWNMLENPSMSCQTNSKMLNKLQEPLMNNDRYAENKIRGTVF